MNNKYKNLLTVFTRKWSLVFAAAILSMALTAQSLSYDDLVNLQKCNLEKAKGFFSYMGFTWASSQNSKQNYEAGGYPLFNDEVEWKRNSETIKYLFQSGAENIVIYSPDSYGFEQLETAAKERLTQSASQTRNNQLSTSYTNGTLRMTFIAEKQNSYYSSKTHYQVLVDNEPDIRRRINSMCNHCKAKGYVTEYEKCSSCKGQGRQSCYSCSGQGKASCQHCSQGYNQCSTCWGKGSASCSSCWGKGDNSCSKCYGQGTNSCNACYGQGTKSCSACYGQGKVSQTLLGQSFYVPCPGCLGKGALTCSPCSGKGQFTCSGCSGKGSLECTRCSGKGSKDCNTCSGSARILCSRCKGSYSYACTKCSGLGYTTAACSYCSGKGVTSREVQRTCPVCNGTKMKSK